MENDENLLVDEGYGEIEDVLDTSSDEELDPGIEEEGEEEVDVGEVEGVTESIENPSAPTIEQPPEGFYLDNTSFDRPTFMLMEREIILNFIVIHPGIKKPTGNMCWDVNTHTSSTFKDFRELLIMHCFKPENNLIPEGMLKKGKEKFNNALWLTYRGCPFVCLFKDVDEEIEVQQVLSTFFIHNRPKKLYDIVPNMLTTLANFIRVKDAIEKFTFRNFEMCIKHVMNEFLFMIEFRDPKNPYIIDEWIQKKEIPTFQKPFTDILSNPSQVKWTHVRVHLKPKEEKQDVEEAMDYLKEMAEMGNGESIFGDVFRLDKIRKITFTSVIQPIYAPLFLLLIG